MKIETVADRATLATAAGLHRIALPGSTISKLGAAYARAFYRFAASSSTERIFVARDENGTIMGGAVLSLDPASLSRRLLLETSLAAHVALRPRLALSMVMDQLRTNFFSRSGAAKQDLPEVVAIFSDETCRNRGVGKEMLAAIEVHLAGLGVRTYMVRTEDRHDNRAIAFYLREGFRPAERTYAYGHWFQLLIKDIESAR